MYIFERLHKDFPQYDSEINTFQKWVERYHSKDWVRKIFDDQKSMYQYVEEAYKIGPGNHGYTKNMARFEKELNFDKDFLQFYIQDMFGDNTDYSDRTVTELRDIIEYKGKHE